MLRKLLKHELKDTAKLLIPLNLTLIVITIIGSFILQKDFLQNDSFELLTVAYMILYILSIVAVFITTVIYLIQHYYKTMYSDQGYLTHTLPVSSASIINTKLLVTCCWLVLMGIVALISMVILVGSAIGMDWSTIPLDLLWEELYLTFGMNIGLLMLVLAIDTILSTILSILTIFSSLAIGQLFNTRRILGAVAAFIGFSVITNGITMVLMSVLGLSKAEATLSSSTSTSLIGADIPLNEIQAWSQKLFAFDFATTIIYAIIFYIICLSITKKKLNLE